MKEINLNVQKARQHSAGGSRNPKVYRADYFEHKTHYNQNKKLGMYGLVYVCAQKAIQGRPLAMLQWQRKTTLSFTMIYTMM